MIKLRGFFHWSRQRFAFFRDVPHPYEGKARRALAYLKRFQRDEFFPFMGDTNLRFDNKFSSECRIGICDDLKSVFAVHEIGNGYRRFFRIDH